MIVAKQYEDKSLQGYYNVGPDECDCYSTGKLVDVFVKNWGEIAWKNVCEQNAPHEANFLKLDCSKLKFTFGWKPRWNVDTAVEKVVEWTKVYANGGDVRECMDKEIKEFFDIK